VPQPAPYEPEDPFSAAAWRVALVDELPDYQMCYFEGWLEWIAARNRVNERLDEAKVAELEQLQQRYPPGAPNGARAAWRCSTWAGSGH
jgi:hypothetical protein